MRGEVPVRQDWESFMYSLYNPDPFLSNGDQWFHDAINSYAAWGATTGSPDVIVAVIDSGVLSTHEDFDSWITSSNIGYGTSPSSYDYNGTFVAGLIAGGLDNGLGGAGVAPWTSILSIRVVDSQGEIQDADIARAIRLAAQNGADIINLSLFSSFFYNYIVQAAIDYATARNCTVIAQAGDLGTNAMVYPGGYNNVICVAATNKSGNRASFSNYGSWVDISAPGEGILSCANSDYAGMSGSSAACAIVSGAAALYMGYFGNPGAAAMEKILKGAVNKCGSSEMGAGIIDVSKLFSGDKTPPLFDVYDPTTDYYNLMQGGEWNAPFEGTLGFTFPQISMYEGATVIFTTDGKNPAILNGQIICGEEFDVLNDWPISLSNFAPGSTVTVKAAVVNGMGTLSKIATLKINIGLPKPDYVQIRVPERIVSGKSVQLGVDIQPLNAGHNVTWSILSSTIPDVKLDKNGVLTTPANSYGTVDVQVSVGAYASQASIYVYSPAPLKTLKINQTGTMKMMVGFVKNAYVTELIDTNGNYLSADDVGVTWTSSNPKVVSVTYNDYNSVELLALAKGSATITAKAADGSGKYAKFKVSVSVPVDGISITCQSQIARGSSATAKATVYPSSAGNKKVNWFVYDDEGDPINGVTISSSGKITVAPFVPAGQEMWIYATAADGGGAVGCTLSYVVSRKCKDFWVGLLEYNPYASYDKKTNRLKAFKLASVTPSDMDYYDMPDVTVLGVLSDMEDVTYIWSSSKPEVASVTYQGFVTAHKPGTATLTAKADDGSGKKYSVKVTVFNPVSTMSIQSGLPNTVWNHPTLAIGKSTTNKVSFGTLYGKPSNTKVKWSLAVYEWQDGECYDYTHWYQTVKKYITISSSGKLTVNKKVYNEWLYCDAITVEVCATATDGTNACAYKAYTLHPPTTELRFIDKSITIHSEEVAWLPFYSDCGGDFSVKSSNPKVGSAFFNSSDIAYGNLGVYVKAEKVSKKSSFKVTLTANDGTNKKATITVNVLP